MNDNSLWDYEDVARRLGLFKNAEKTIPDIEMVKRLVREGRLKSLVMSDRRIMFDPQDIENYIKGLKGETITPQPNNRTEDPNTNDALVEKQKQIDTITKAQELHKKTLEYDAMRAGFKTAEEYQQALNNLKGKEDILNAIKLSLSEMEQTLKAREIVIKEKEDNIENACNDKLTECEDECVKMIDDTKKQCEQMVARKKVEIKRLENTEFDDMEQVVHEFEVINLTIYEWGFPEYGEQIDVMINRIIISLNENATLQDLWQDYKYVTDIICEVIAISQNRKDANRSIDFRNQLGQQVKTIMVKLHLDDERLLPPTQLQKPTLPMD